MNRCLMTSKERSRNSSSRAFLVRIGDSGLPQRKKLVDTLSEFKSFALTDCSYHVGQDCMVVEIGSSEPRTNIKWDTRDQTAGSEKGFGFPPDENTPAVNNCVLTRGRPFLLHDATAHLRPSMWDPVDSLAPLFRQLDGRFSFFACDGEHFVAATDIFGAGSLYFSRSDSGVCIATHLGLLLAAQGTVVHDEAAAIRCFLIRGTSFGETPFRGASRLAGCHFIAGSIKHGGTPRFEIRPYGRLEDLLALTRADSCQPEDDRSPQDHLDQLFSESLVREQYDKKAIVTLSAGNDSRFVALQFQRHLDLKPRTLTAGSDMVFDSDYIKAGLVAKRLGLQNTRTGWDL